MEVATSALKAGSVDQSGLQQCGRAAECSSPERNRCQQRFTVVRVQAQGGEERQPSRGSLAHLRALSLPDNG
jgi:hypothetical protein